MDSDLPQHAMAEAASILESATEPGVEMHVARAEYARAAAVLQQARLAALSSSSPLYPALRLFHSCLAFTPFEEVCLADIRELAASMRHAPTESPDIEVARRSAVRAGFRVFPRGGIERP